MERGDVFWKMDGLVVSIRETGRARRDRWKKEVWERRWVSCLFEDKSERQCSEEVHIHKHTRTHTNSCVCALTLELTHMQTHTNTNTVTYSLVHPLPRGEVVKGHG